MTGIAPPPKNFKAASPDDIVIGNNTDGSDMRIDAETADDIIKSTLKPQHARDPNILKFIQLFCLYQNKKRAAEELGLNILDANNLLKRPDIAECVRKLNSLAVERFGYSADEVVEVMKNLAFFDPADLERPDGSFHKSMRDIPFEARMALKRLRVREELEKDPNGIVIGVKAYIIDYDFHDRTDAVKTLGSEKDVFKKVTVTQHEIGKDARNVLLESQERANQRLLGMRDVGGGKGE